MTIIAYSGKEGVLVADRLACWETERCPGPVQKILPIRQLPPGGNQPYRKFLVGVAGTMTEGMRLFNHYLFGARHAGVLEPYTRIDTERHTTLLIVEILPKGCWSADLVGSQGSLTDVANACVAIGCGSDYATGAMYAGASAHRAAEIACELDVHCGGGLEVFDIAAWRKEPETQYIDVFSGSRSL